MAVTYAAHKSTRSSKQIIATAGLVGLLAALLTGVLHTWQVAPVVGWDATALIFGIRTWATIWPMNGKMTASHAVREDPSRRTSEIIVLLACLASLVAVGVVLVASASEHGSAKTLLVALGVLSVIIGWVTVHTLFLLRYAELYYRSRPRGVDFSGTDEPSYSDIAYLAFTIGMTFQVSDTGLKTNAFRRTALGHSLLSYLFGTVIVATTINLVAGLTK